MTRAHLFRLVLAVIIAFPALRAAPAYSWHGSGNVTALAIDPQRPTTIYAGTPDRGVFKTTDGGATWSATGLTNVSVSALAINPQTPSIVYAGTNGGVFKSSDGGQSWFAVNTGLADLYVTDVVIDRRTPAILYALVPNTGVFKSADGGAHWSATGLMTGNICDSYAIYSMIYSVSALAIDPRTPTTLYAAVYCATSEMDWAVVFESTDGGTNWFGIGPGNWFSGFDFAGIGDLAVDPRSPTAHVYAVGGNYVETMVIRTTDGGAGGWSVLITEQTSGSPFSALAIASRTDPEAPATLYALTNSRGVFKSTDGGVTWSAVNMGLTETLQAYGNLNLWNLVVDPLNPTTLYLGTAVGVFKSTDGGGYWSRTGLIQHSPLSSMSLNPTSVIGGAVSTGTVTLITAAPVGGVTVTLSSNNPAVATVPASVTVPAGATSANFTVSTYSVTTRTAVMISAAFDGATRSAWLSVYAPTTLNYISLSPTSAIGGTASIGTVVLMTAAPVGGVRVTLSSSNPAVATVPASVTLPAEAFYAYFTVSTSPVTTSTSVTVEGSYGGITKSAVLTVIPGTTLSLVSLNTTSVTAGSTSTGAVILSAAAPTGGAVVTLSSSNPSVAAVPASVTVPAGTTSAGFTVSTSGAAATTTVTISGAYGGVTKSAVLTVVGPTLSSVSLNPTSVPAGSASTGTVTLSSAAPAGGAAVALSSSNNTLAIVPASVTVPAGATSANFAVAAAYCTSGSVGISGTYGGVTRSAELTVTLPVIDSVTIQLADYFASRRELRVGAKSSSSRARLWVYVTSTGELIGELTNLGDGKYSGQFPRPVHPQNITIRSSLCGSATGVVRSK